MTGAAFPSPFAFRKYGQSAIEVSEIFSKVGECVDDLCVVRSMCTDIPNHEPSLMMMNCGDIRQVRPSFGSWVTYGLGSENQNLPGFIVLCPDGLPTQGNQNWRSAFLPGAYQATYIDTRETQIDKLIENIRNRLALAPRINGEQLDLLGELDRGYQERRQNDALLEARVQSFELAYRMQMEADDAFDLTKEPASVLKLYGEGLQARQMMIARRLLERGVRFVQVWHGQGQPWDSHDDIPRQPRASCAGMRDQPIVALAAGSEAARDARGYAGALGRRIWSNANCGTAGPGGRLRGCRTDVDHNPYGFSGSGLAGADLKKWLRLWCDGRVSVLRLLRIRYTCTTLHATHTTSIAWIRSREVYLIVSYAGRDFRLTDVAGHVVHDLLL